MIDSGGLALQMRTSLRTLTKSMFEIFEQESDCFPITDFKAHLSSLIWIFIEQNAGKFLVFIKMNVG